MVSITPAVFRRTLAVLAAAVCTAGASAVHANVVLPAIFGSNMVLPAGKTTPVWGEASPGEVVTVTAAGQTARTVTDPQGHFRVTLPALTSPGPFEIVVQGNNRLVLSNVALGEIWLASGQSNMEWPLYASEGADSEIHAPAAAASALRLFQVRRPSPEQLSRDPSAIRGRWSLVSPDSVARFSAVAYHFGRTLADAHRGRVIGLVHTSWGGSRAEAWIPRAALATDPQFAPAVRALDVGLPAAQLAATQEKLRAWEQQRQLGDLGDRGVSLGFARPGAAGPGWRVVETPGTAEAAVGRSFDGAIWFRTEVALPAGFSGQPAFLRLGPIDQCDITYVEGALVGSTCETAIAPERYPRGYVIPAALTRRRRLTVAVRIWDPAGPGGFQGPPSALRLSSGDPEGPSVPLDGRWYWRIERELPAAIAGAGPRPPLPPGFPHYQSPGVLWNNMVAGLAPFPFTGVLWYQGESNTKEAFAYRTLLPTLMQQWRRAFESPHLPFLLVQLAAYHPAWPGPGQRSEEEWAELREAQALVAARDPDAALAITLDLGTRDDIHPRNKREVGRRLGLLALAKVHGEPVAAWGPVYQKHTREKDQVRVRFQHGTGLAVAAGALQGRLVGFELAGTDRQFVTAEARIEGDSVLLSAPGLQAPVAVRYGWGDDPPCNLTNWAGLPAAPFRTDSWPRFSQHRVNRASPARPAPTINSTVVPTSPAQRLP
jgi:sialate O-acetylesterase